MLTITQTLDSFLNLLREKEEGKPFSRFKSWEYCHNAFMTVHNWRKRELKDDEIENLALHLSFYLASWGMYRGSSFILQRDYKTHIDVVKAIFKSKYDELWEFNPVGKTDEELEKVAELVDDAYKDIEEAYGDILEKGYCEEETGTASNSEVGDHVTVTLVTKVLMGTFAVSPAFDRFFADGAKSYKRKDTHELKNHSFASKAAFEEKILALFIFAREHENELKLIRYTPKIFYPIMKIIDMYFWEIGYEIGFYNELAKLEEVYLNEHKENKKSYEKQVRLLKTVFPSLVEMPGLYIDKVRNVKAQIAARHNV